MAETIRRDIQIEEFTNKIVFQPLSTWLAPVLVRLGVSAHVTSILGMTSGLAGAWLYYHYALSPLYALAGFGAMCIWHVFDGADGQVARITNTQSSIGKVIDGTCDYVVFITVYVLLAYQLDQIYPGWAFPLVATAGIFHAVQASAYEAQRQMFDYWGLGKKSARLGNGTMRTPRSLGEALFYAYEYVQLRVSGIDPAFVRVLEARIGETASDTPLRARYAGYFAQWVRRWGIMCANYRTFGIFAACLVQRPELYFLAEIIPLTLAHGVLMILQNRANRKFEQALVQQA